MNECNDNRTTISVITTTVAIMAFICISTTCFLSFKGIEIPPELNTITSSLCGSLVSMLVKTSPTQVTPLVPPPSASNPSPVVVTNVRENPVHTEEAEAK